MLLPDGASEIQPHQLVQFLLVFLKERAGQLLGFMERCRGIRAPSLTPRTVEKRN